jgi:hypothetical protein
VVTAILGYINLIEKLEKTLLVVASTLHGGNVSDHIHEEQIAHISVFSTNCYSKEINEMKVKENER